MFNQVRTTRATTRLGVWLALLLLIGACAAPGRARLNPADSATADEQSAEITPLQPVTRAEGEKLRVVATTNILADVVQNVGGDTIALTTLLPVGADPHSYSAAPQDLRSLRDAQVVFAVGAGVEDSLLSVLENREGASALVAVNAGLTVQTRLAADHAAEEGHAENEHHHAGLDPHTWMAVPSVIDWVETIAETLGALDPANAATYEANAARYRAELTALDQEIERAVATIPAPQRKLVTDHDTLGYFADRYGFTVIGSVIPSFSTLAAPSAQELAALQKQIAAEGVNAIFVGSTVNPELAEQLAQDLGIVVAPLYTDSLSGADGPAATYLDLMRYDVETIVAALQ